VQSSPWGGRQGGGAGLGHGGRGSLMRVVDSEVTVVASGGDVPTMASYGAPVGPCCTEGKRGR
jgi:hypothetical protein